MCFASQLGGGFIEDFSMAQDIKKHTAIPKRRHSDGLETSVASHTRHSPTFSKIGWSWIVAEIGTTDLSGWVALQTSLCKRIDSRNQLHMGQSGGPELLLLAVESSPLIDTI